MPFIKRGQYGTQDTEGRYSPRTVPIRTSSCSGASTITRTAATGRSPPRVAVHRVAADSMSTATAPVARSCARSWPRTTWSDPVRAPRCTVRPGAALVSASASRALPVQVTVARGSRVSSATTRSPGFMPGTSPAQNPVARTAARSMSGRSSARPTARSAARGPIPVRSRTWSPAGPRPALRSAACSMRSAQATSSGSGPRARSPPAVGITPPRPLPGVLRRGRTVPRTGSGRAR